MPEAHSIGAVVSAVLENLSLTPTEFAYEYMRRSGEPLHGTTVSCWMQSTRNPELSHIIVLRDHFGVSPNKFFRYLNLKSLA
jgi:hypothetical protein